MNIADYKLIEESIFNMYQSILNHLRLTRTRCKDYNIFIARTYLQNNLYQVTIKIENKNTDEQKFIFSDKLPYEESLDLIENIRIDFNENHYISFSTVNIKEKIQTLQNTNFTLRIELKNDKEIEDAINFNTKINTNGERHKVLTKA